MLPYEPYFCQHLEVTPDEERSEIRELPPIILHPFDNRAGAARIDSPIGSFSDQKYFEARYAELRMLCFLGKDLDRWLGQCMETSRGQAGLEGAHEASFIGLLLFDPPVSVTRKMSEWGVGNYQIVFSRALGLNMIFPLPPPASALSETLLRTFHLSADALFDLRLKTFAGAELKGQNFQFELYASSEYSKLLERSWGDFTG
jgi:hypothetical protein